MDNLGQRVIKQNKDSWYWASDGTEDNLRRPPHRRQRERKTWDEIFHRYVLVPLYNGRRVIFRELCMLLFRPFQDFFQTYHVSWWKSHICGSYGWSRFLKSLAVFSAKLNDVQIKTEKTRQESASPQRTVFVSCSSSFYLGLKSNAWPKLNQIKYLICFNVKSLWSRKYLKVKTKPKRNLYVGIFSEIYQNNFFKECI